MQMNTIQLQITDISFSKISVFKSFNLEHSVFLYVVHIYAIACFQTLNRFLTLNIVD